MPAERVIGNYVLGPILGRGGMSCVHAAEHRFLGDRVAIKLLRTQLAGDPDATAAFLAEATRTRAIDHPGVVRVIDFGSDDGDLYLVMERLDGETLAARLERSGVLDEPEARRFGAAIADGVAAAHARGIVHRDLKPGNVVVVGDQPKIVDFGIARSLDRGAAAVTGSRIGTIAYMAPEQLAGGLVAPCVDIWALGVILYEALAGRLPFDDFADGRAPQLFETPARLGQLVPVSPALDALVAACLERDPARRPRSMAAIAEALRGARPDERFTEELPPSIGIHEAGRADRADRERPRGGDPADIVSAGDHRGATRASATDPEHTRMRDLAATVPPPTVPPAMVIQAGAHRPDQAEQRAGSGSTTMDAFATERRPRGRTVALVMVLVTVALGAVWSLRARRASIVEPSSMTVGTTPPPPAATPPAPAATPPAPAATPPAPAATPPAPAATPPAPAATPPAPAATPPAPAATPPALAATPPALAATPPAARDNATAVTVEVRSAPAGAAVIVGGKRVGVTPATLALDVPASILVTRVGYQPARVRAVRAGSIDVRLVPVRPHKSPRAAGETLD
jgi:serine/threonine-protein kinase